MEERKALYQYLSKILNIDANDIESRVKQHDSAHTIEEWKPHIEVHFPDAVMCKNLFLRDKKKESLWLVVAVHDTEIDMKKLTKYLGFSSGTLRFAPDELLLQVLRVPQGSVTPLGLIYDKEKKVNVIIDERMIEKENQKLLFHPLSNEFTLYLSTNELKEFLNSCGQKVTYLNFNKI